MLSSNQIRESFINYFKEKDHKHVLSSPLIPHDDPSILFTNAGMNQFKDYFLGITKPNFSKAVTCQKVMRAGGKHNDLENVGYTARHQTFFEMLGNFSFGDYFKEKAIIYAWDFLTSVLKIEGDRLAVSVFESDEEAFKIWNQVIGLPKNKIAKLGKADNFWSMGDKGPCGPCSEIHYQLSDKKISKSAAQSLLEDDGRFLEIWNLVFMQYDQKSPDKLIDLPNPSIDTGCGLERLASVMQNVQSNFDTDSFTPIIKNISRMAGYEYLTDANKDVSVRVVADHIRSAAFVIADGALPSNEGRGYVIRRIIRRALRHIGILGIEHGGFTTLVAEFLPSCFSVYPEVKQAQKLILDIITQEENQFQNTLKKGMFVLDEIIHNTKQAGKNKVSGADIFKLYDTYGFPADISKEILNNEKLFFDQAEFSAYMEKQKQKARTSGKNKLAGEPSENRYQDQPLRLKEQSFVGYNTLQTVTDATDIFQHGKAVESIDTKNDFDILLNTTPFYATSGGQVGDSGVLETKFFKINVLNTTKLHNGFHLCHCRMLNSAVANISLADLTGITASVNVEKRHATALNHTAVHLLHAALRTVIGTNVRQAGSYVDHARLRFDFNHHQSLNPEELAALDSFVFDQITANHAVDTAELTLNEALAKGALAFFADKYGEKVRMVTASPSSIELCGGTHAKRTGEIGFFKIVSEASIASGIRRIEAVTYHNALDYVNKNLQKLFLINKLLLASGDDTIEKFDNLILQKKQLEKDNYQYLHQIAELKINQQLPANPYADKNLCWINLDKSDQIRIYTKLLKTQFKDGISILWQATNADYGNLALVVGDNQANKINAGKLMQELIPLIDGKGGGGRDFAQASGYLKDKIKLLNHISQYVKV